MMRKLKHSRVSLPAQVFVRYLEEKCIPWDFLMTKTVIVGPLRPAIWRELVIPQLDHMANKFAQHTITDVVEKFTGSSDSPDLIWRVTFDRKRKEVSE